MLSHQEFYLVFTFLVWTWSFQFCKLLNNGPKKLCSLPLYLAQPFSLAIWNWICEGEVSFILGTRNKSRVLTSSMYSDELNIFRKELPTIYLQYLSCFIFLIVIFLVLPVLLELLDFPKTFSAVAVKVRALNLLNHYIVKTKSPQISP